MRKPFFAGKVHRRRLLRHTLDDNVLLCLPRPVNEPVRQLRRVAAPPVLRKQYPADLHTVRIIFVIDDISDKALVLLDGVHKRRFGQPRIVQECFRLHTVIGRLQIAHHHGI